MVKSIMEEALEEVERSGRLDIQKRVFSKNQDPLDTLVRGFAAALFKKLKAAEEKYGYKNDWARPDWADICREHMHEHLEKGDPLDVAAYAAFCWHHGWSTKKDG